VSSSASPSPARINALPSTAFAVLDVPDFMFHHMVCDERIYQTFSIDQYGRF
jgi:hypothetical protein